MVRRWNGPSWKIGRRVAARSEWGDGGDVPFPLEPSSPQYLNVLSLSSAALSPLFATPLLLRILFHASSESPHFQHSHLLPPSMPMTLFLGLMIFLTTTSSNPRRTMDRKKSRSRPFSSVLGIAASSLLFFFFFSASVHGNNYWNYRFWGSLMK